jgi:hypothetical protein
MTDIRTQNIKRISICCSITHFKTISSLWSSAIFFESVILCLVIYGLRVETLKVFINLSCLDIAPAIRLYKIAKMVDITRNIVFTDSSSASSSSDQHKHTKSRQKHHHEHAHFHLIKRTTFTMCLITVCFVVSYFPHLSLKIMVFKKPNFISDMNFSEKYLYNTFVWCFFFFLPCKFHHLTRKIIFKKIVWFS